MVRFSFLVLVALAFLAVPLGCSSTDDPDGSGGDNDGNGGGDDDGNGGGDDDNGGGDDDDGSGGGDDDGSGTGADDGSGTGADDGSGTGADDGSGTGADDGSGTGADDGSGTGGNDLTPSTSESTDPVIGQDTSFDTSIWENRDSEDIDAYRDTAVTSETVGYDAGIPDASFDAGYDAGTCADWDITIRLNPSRVMILQDISSSMREGGDPDKWTQARSALISLLSTFGFSNMLHFGLDVFPDRRDCFANEPLVIDSAPNNGQNIFDLLTLIELSQSTPLFMAMGNFLDPSYAPIFSSKEFPSYLIIVSDGKDTCGNETNHFPDEQYGANAAQLGKRSETLRDDAEIYTIAIGFGDAADPEQLDAIAAKGGTDYSEHIQARNREELEAVFHDLAAYTINCEFTIIPESNSDANTYEILWEEVEFSLNGDAIHRDPQCAAGTGWDWVDAPDYTTVEFCEELCAVIRNSERTDVSAEFTCINTVIPI